jgi:NAD(P)H dehydrogenase (quinone)
MDLIIFAHPDNRKSHNAAILSYIRDRMTTKNTPHTVLDLYAEKFDPVLKVVTESSAGSTFKEIADYQKLVKDADRLIFIYPVLWYNMPAILKGFVERVLTTGFAFDFKKDSYGKLRVVPLLKGKKAVVINTYGHGEALFRKHGRCATKVLDTAVLGFCGIKTKRVDWFGIQPGIGMPDDIRAKIDQALG